VEVEFDLQGYTPIAAYPLLSSNQPVLMYADTASASPSSLRAHSPA
jgi:hypothetical protein